MTERLQHAFGVNLVVGGLIRNSLVPALLEFVKSVGVKYPEQMFCEKMSIYLFVSDEVLV